MLIIIIWAIVSIAFIGNPFFSLQEMQASPALFLQTIPPPYWSNIRFIGIAIMGANIYLLANHFFPKDRLKAILFFTIMPWIYIISHEYNPIVLLFTLLLTIHIVSLKYRRYLHIVLLGFIVFVALKSNTADPSYIIDKARTLIPFLNLTNLFLQMEPLSSYLRIPRNGYFSIVFLLPFILSFYHSTTKQWSTSKNYIIPTIFSLLFFLVYPSNHLIFSGVGLLLLLSIFIILGLIKITTNRIIAAGFIMISLSLFVYFLESYIRQYPMRYSVERSEGKIKLMEYIINNPNKHFYLPADDDLKKLTNYYQNHGDFTKVVFIESDKKFINTLKLCKEENHECVFGDMGIEKYGIDKHSIEIKHIKFTNSLSAYYIY